MPDATALCKRPARAFGPSSDLFSLAEGTEPNAEAVREPSLEMARQLVGIATDIATSRG